MLGELAQDLRYGIRTLLKSPGLTTIAIVTLALGIGANSAIFSFVDGVLLRPLPYRHADRLVNVLEKPPGGVRNPISALNFLDWRTQSTAFDALAATTGGSMTLSGVDEPVCCAQAAYQRRTSTSSRSRRRSAAPSPPARMSRARITSSSSRAASLDPLVALRCE